MFESFYGDTRPSHAGIPRFEYDANVLVFAGDDHNAGGRKVLDSVFLESGIECTAERLLHWERGVDIELKDSKSSTLERPLEVAQAPAVQVPGGAIGVFPSLIPRAFVDLQELERFGEVCVIAHIDLVCGDASLPQHPVNGLNRLLGVGYVLQGRV